MKKKSWVILNTGEGIYWCVDNAGSSSEAIEQYVTECFGDLEKPEQIDIMAIEIKAKKDFVVNVSKVLKTEIVDAEQ